MEATPKPKTTRRAFLQNAGVTAALAGHAPAWAVQSVLPSASSPYGMDTQAVSAGGHGYPSNRRTLHLETDPKTGVIPFLSWDTEGGSRLKTNLLRNRGIRLRTLSGPEPVDVADFHTVVQQTADGVRYIFSVHGQSTLEWKILASQDGLTMSVSANGPHFGLSPLQLLFPFDPAVTPTTVLPATWHENGSFETPLVINAPDFGQMLLEMSPHANVKGFLNGSRFPPAVDLILEIPALSLANTCTISLTPCTLPAPAGLEDHSLWKLARRGWFGAMQPCAAWGDCSHGYGCGTAGVLANNVVSDPASVSTMFYSDLIFWTPQIAKSISTAQLTRQTVEFWIKQRTLGTHEIPGYRDYIDFLDGNPNQLICAWDYVESTGDLPWLEQVIDSLEAVAEFTARRDQDQDGLVEATQSGNANTLWANNRSSNWFDAMNYGYKDAYSNALIYRGWRCLADMEAKLHRAGQQQRYTYLADRLKGAYVRQLLNPETGWITCWKSMDGSFHDYCSPIINGLAISYGLVEPGHGRQIVDKLWAKLRTAKFDRFDLGIPSTLEPVRRSDYLQPKSNGIPAREDGTDTFQGYQNGGIAAGYTLHFLIANYIVGYGDRADLVLQKMLERQQRGLFQNGVQSRGYPYGGEWTTWNGTPSGAEGYLADTYFFLLAVLLREPALRRRQYRPLFSS